MADRAVNGAPLLIKDSSANESHLYGSIGVGQANVDILNEEFTRNAGGLVSELPTRGYCLVFEVEPEYGFGKTSPYKLVRSGDNGDEIKMIQHEDMTDSDFGENGWEQKMKDFTDNRHDNLLKYFKDANIEYKIEKSTDRMNKYLYVVISAQTSIAEEWADRHDIDVPIEPAEAVRVGRLFKEFDLAHRTRIDDSDPAKFAVPHRENPSKYEEYNKLELEYWNGIHIGYNTSIPRNVYKKDPCDDDPNVDDTVLNHRLYLRVLYEMLTDDRELGGANFIVEKYLKNAHHPLVSFFALHECRSERVDLRKKNIFLCNSPKKNVEFCDDIRGYYGESVGFYFHFLCHYTKWLYPMAVLGTIWFGIQLAVEKDYGIATPGSTAIVLIAIMWSTMMIENWYRREWKLKYKWGMNIYAHIYFV